MASTKVPAIYRIPSKVDPELKNYLESVQEAIEIRLGRRGDELDRAITLRELISSGLASDLKSSPFNPNNPEVQTFQPVTIYDGTIPPLPTGFSAGGAFRTITLKWDMPPMANFAYTEIWRSTDSFIDNATRVDTTIASEWSDTVAYASTYYYWINFVSTSGIVGPKAGPKSATTAADIGAVMSALSEELADLPGYSALQTADNAVEIIQGSGVPDNNTNRADGTDPKAGDLYLRTSNQQLYIRNAANNAWVECSDDSVVQVIGSTSYTGASLTTAIATAQTDLSAQATSISNLNTTVSAKGDIYRASSAPSGGTYVAGDIWIDTDDNQMYQWNGSAWVTARDTGVATSTQLNSVSSAASNAQSTADSKTKTFRQDDTPTAITVGDVWIDTNDGNKMYIATATGTGGWQEATDAQIAAAQAAADSKAKTFNQGKTTAGIPGTSGGGSAGYADGASIVKAGDIWIDTDATTTILKGGTFATSTVNTTDNTVEFSSSIYNALSTGDYLTYSNGGGTALGGLTNNINYYAVKVASTTKIKLAASQANALAASPTTISLTGTGNNAQSLTQSSTESNRIYIAQANGADAIAANEWVSRDNSSISSAVSSVTQLSQTTADLAGNASASHVLQVNANGHVAGIALSSATNSSGQVVSDIVFQADRVFFTNSSGVTPQAAMVIQNNEVWINAARIKSAAIQHAQIGSLNADTITTGTMSATKLDAGTIETVAITIGASTGARVELDGGNSRIVVIDNSA